MLSLLFKLILIISGSVVGFFFPDIEAVITAFWVEPNHPVSQMVRSYYKNRQFKLLRFYWIQNRKEYQTLIIHSAFFQIILTIFSVFIVSSGGSIFVSFLCLSFMFRLFYEQYLDYKRGLLKEWFWAINIPLTKNFYRVYFSVLGIVSLYLLYTAF